MAFYFTLFSFFFFLLSLFLLLYCLNVCILFYKMNIPPLTKTKNHIIEVKMNHYSNAFSCSPLAMVGRLVGSGWDGSRRFGTLGDLNGSCKYLKLPIYTHTCIVIIVCFILAIIMHKYWWECDCLFLV